MLPEGEATGSFFFQRFTRVVRLILLHNHNPTIASNGRGERKYTEG